MNLNMGLKSKTGLSERAESQSYLKMGQSTRESGALTQMNETEEESSCGRMVRSTKDIGQEERQMEEVDSFMQMEMSMMESGRMIRLMGMVSTNTWMGLGIKDTGKKINNTAKEKSLGLTVLCTRECT